MTEAIAKQVGVDPNEVQRGLKEKHRKREV